mmetsp:Transcript_3222/g.9940  ORF Transcript_3222/g.9940 Transcript_3222/m.9940 type:complete len:299 (-) Transcript_3222:857-1753(-)
MAYTKYGNLRLNSGANPNACARMIITDGIPSLNAPVALKPSRTPLCNSSAADKIIGIPPIIASRGDSCNSSIFVPFRLASSSRPEPKYCVLPQSASPIEPNTSFLLTCFVFLAFPTKLETNRNRFASFTFGKANFICSNAKNCSGNPSNILATPGTAFFRNARATANANGASFAPIANVTRWLLFPMRTRSLKWAECFDMRDRACLLFLPSNALLLTLFSRPSDVSSSFTTSLISSLFANVSTTASSIFSSTLSSASIPKASFSSSSSKASRNIEGNIPNFSSASSSTPQSLFPIPRK